MDLTTLEAEGTAFGAAARPIRTATGWHDAVDPIGLHIVQNPASAESLCVLSIAGHQDVRQAVMSAGEAATSGPWARTTPADRAAVLRGVGRLLAAHADELAALEALDAGRPITTASAFDLPYCREICFRFAETLDQRGTPPSSLHLVQPPRVVAALASPHRPLISASWKLAATLANGSACILKPDEATPLSVLRLVDLIAEHADLLPHNVVQCVYGDGRTGDLLAHDLGVDHVMWSGSRDTAAHLMRAATASNLKTLSLESGWRSLGVMWKDAPHLEQAVDTIVNTRLLDRGPHRFGPTHVFVHADIFADMVDTITESVTRIRVGLPFDAETTRGPCVSAGHAWRVANYIEDAKAVRADMVAGGGASAAAHHFGGCYVQPTVVLAQAPDLRIALEAVPGPVLCLLRFSTPDDLAAMPRTDDPPASVAIWTADETRAHDSMRMLGTRQGWWNPQVPTCGEDAAAPFWTAYTVAHLLGWSERTELR